MEVRYLANYSSGSPFKIALSSSQSIDKSHRDAALRVHKLALEKMEAELQHGPTPMTALPYAQMAQATGVQLHFIA